MTSTPSTILGLELQGTGDNVNLWGEVLNSLFSQLEEASHSVLAVTVDANVTLTNTNYQSNQSRRAGLRFTGAGGFTVTCAELPRAYIVQNDCTDDVTLAVGATSVTMEAGERDLFWTDGTTAYLMGFSTLNTNYLQLAGGTMTGQIKAVGDPVEDDDLARKKYIVDELMSVTATAELPGQSGNSGKFLTTNGTVSSWETLGAALEAIKLLTVTDYGIGSLENAAPIEIDDTDSPYTASFGEEIFVDCSSGTVEIDLPAATAGSQPIIIHDQSGNCSVNNITLDPNGSETIADLTSIEMDIDRMKIILTPFAGSWSASQ